MLREYRREGKLLSGRHITLQTRNQFKLDFLHNMQCCPSSSKRKFLLGVQWAVGQKAGASVAEGAGFAQFMGEVNLSWPRFPDPQEEIEKHYIIKLLGLPQASDGFSCERRVWQQSSRPARPSHALPSSPLSPLKRLKESLFHFSLVVQGSWHMTDQNWTGAAPPPLL